MRLRALVLVLAGALLLAGCSAPLPGGAARTEAVELQRGDVTLTGILQVPALEPGQRVPLAILMHGWTGWNDDAHLKRGAEQLGDAGIASLRVNFTGHGLSGGEVTDMRAAVPVELEDAQVILDFARGLDFVSEISLVGYSLGGLVASVFAGEHPDEIAALVLLAPAPPYGVYSPAFQAAEKYDGPVLILQGDSDELVSVQVAERYLRAFDSGELRILEHENHAFTYGTDIEGMTVQFLLANS